VTEFQPEIDIDFDFIRESSNVSLGEQILTGNRLGILARHFLHTVFVFCTKSQLLSMKMKLSNFSFTTYDRIWTMNRHLVLNIPNNNVPSISMSICTLQKVEREKNIVRTNTYIPDFILDICLTSFGKRDFYEYVNLS